MILSSEITNSLAVFQPNGFHFLFRGRRVLPDRLARYWAKEFFSNVLLSAAVVGMMMMAELVQGQASVAQPGMKADGFADALHRARQVKQMTERNLFEIA